LRFGVGVECGRLASRMGKDPWAPAADVETRGTEIAANATHLSLPATSAAGFRPNCRIATLRQKDPRNYAQRDAAAAAAAIATKLQTSVAHGKVRCVCKRLLSRA
jgi:hypothetical protein